MTLVYMFYKIIVYKTLFYIILFYITMVDMTFFYDTMVYNSWQACHVSFVESLLSTQALRYPRLPPQCVMLNIPPSQGLKYDFNR